MKNTLLKVLLFLLSLILSALYNPTAHADSVVGEIEFTNCKVSDLTGKLQVKAECATLSVPENYEDPDGKNIDLHIARFKAKNDKNRTDATTLLAGGPGQAAIETFAPYIRILNDINSSQDIYLVDQRGTGKSNQMQCDFDDDEFEETMEFDPVITKEFTQKCLDQLPGDARFYTTSVAMKDLDMVRAALGIEQWNLYGGSYGTRTAQHYLKQYPDHVRTVILDAVVPVGKPLGPEIALEGQRALDAMLARCSADTDCNTAFPNLSNEVSTLIADLKENPRTVQIENIASGKLEEFTFTDTTLTGGVRLALYSPRSLSILPTLLHEAAANNHYGPLARQAINMTRSMVNAMSIGMSNSVMCTEDAPQFATVQLDQTALERSFMGSDFLEGLKVACSIWPKGPLDEGFHDPVISDKPILLLSGDKDPITPPSYAEETMQQMTNSKHIVVEGQGHIQMGTGCMPTILAKFIDAASFADIDTSCMDKVKPEPFFIDFNGPTP